MADDIEIQITANDSSFRSAIGSVKRDIEDLSRTASGPVRSQSGYSDLRNPETVKYLQELKRVQDAYGAGKSGLENIAKNLKAAKDEAGGLKESLGPIGNQLTGMAIGAASVSSAFRLAGDAVKILKFTLASGLDVETAKFRSKEIVGDTKDWDQLQKSADKTSTSVSNFAAVRNELYSTGASREAANAMAEHVVGISKAMGEDPGGLANIIGRIQGHGEVTFRELSTLARLSGGATRGLALEFRDLDQNVQETTMSLDRQRLVHQIGFAEESRSIEDRNTQVERQYATESRHISAVADVSSKLGVTKQAFTEWQGTSGVGGFRPWTAGDFRTGLRGALSTQFSQGLKELSEQTGVSEQDLGGYASQLGPETLLNYANQRRTRLRQEQVWQQQDEQRQRARGEQDYGFGQERGRLALTQGAYYRRRQIAEEILSQFMQTSEAEKEFPDTPAGKLAQAGHLFTRAHEIAGQTIIENPLKGIQGVANIAGGNPVMGALNLLGTGGIQEMWTGAMRLLFGSGKDTTHPDTGPEKDLSAINSNTKDMVGLLKQFGSASGGD